MSIVMSWSLLGDRDQCLLFVTARSEIALPHMETFCILLYQLNIGFLTKQDSNQRKAYHDIKLRPKSLFDAWQVQ